MSARLRIGVDGRAFSSPAAGIRRYVWEIYGALAGTARDVEIVAIGAAAGARLPAGVIPHAAIPFPTNVGWMALSIPLAVRSAAIDVYHAPANTAPLWGVHPQVVTIHDVSPIRRPEWDAYRNDPLRRRFYRVSALAADRVLTVSAFSGREITEAYAIPRERIDVIPLAAAAGFTPGPFDPAALPPGVTTPYALHVGDLQVRRNLTTALDAVLEVRHVNPDRGLTLVCAGVDRGVGPALQAQARAANDPDAIVVTGPVSESALVNLYRGAAMLAYPSRYEGFGLPLLEAMQCGVPVVAANAASIPEIVGDAGILLDPLDAKQWAKAIFGVLTDEAHAARLREAGLKRASIFSWMRTAHATLAILRRTAEQAGRARS
jgi:glycosyltransferase involved in cell wall biosynthesis